MAEKQINSMAVKQVTELLHDIATMANAIKDMHQCVAATHEPLVVAAHYHAVQCMVTQIGFLADLGSESMGGFIVRGGHEDWMIYASLATEQEVSHG